MNVKMNGKHSSLGHRPSSSRGVALVVVLGMLVLVLVLVVAFLSSVSVELQSAKKYSSGADARALADSAVSLVISQIQDATAKPQMAWASQPGMVRTYDDTGEMDTAYKLYSSDTLRVTGSYDPAGEVPTNWAEDLALFTDLNKPVAVSGKNHYPIIDPVAVASGTSGGAPLPGMPNGSTPIEGCYLDTANAVVATSATQTNPVPMPVKWMYVLEDGVLVAPSGGSGGTAIFSGSNQPTDSNPIVGRIAFWADDETSKVNINTASEGTYWDRPWFAGATGNYEPSLVDSMPAQNEFQRFPGHPAMTSLSVVFPPALSEIDATTGAPTLEYKQRIYDIIPRISDGGSMSGTTLVTSKTPPLVPDADRLFASVDEFFFQAKAAAPRLPNQQSGDSDLGLGDIEKVRFFLTANSRSPEVNMFNKPRITLWPLQANSAQVNNPSGAAERNSKDKLIAFCSTIGDLPYYFQRYNTYDPVVNVRNSGQSYNPSQSPMPSSQSPTMDWDRISRNRDLYAYLQSLTSSPIPGLGGRLAGTLGKYNLSTRDQILTQMFDYVRSGVNVVSNGMAPEYSFSPFIPKKWVSGEFQVVPLEVQQPGISYKTKGFGQFPTVTQAAVVFLRTDNVLVNGVEQTVGYQEYTPPTGNVVTSGTTPSMTAFLILQPFTPTPGMPPWSTNVRYKVEGLENFSANGVSLGFPANATNLLTCLDGEDHATALTGLELTTQYFGLKIKKLGVPGVGAVDEEELYPFYAATIPLPSSDPTFAFSGGSIVVKIYSGYATSLNDSELVQTIRMNFPSATLPIPEPAYATGIDGKDKDDPDDNVYFVRQYNRILTRFGEYETGGGYGVQRNGQHNPLPLVRPQDTVRSVEARYAGPAGGDYRLIAGLVDVPESYFEGHGLKDAPADGKRYSDSVTASRLIHSLRVDAGSGSSPTQNGVNGFYHGSGGPKGKLLASAFYYTGGGKKGNREPVAPRGLPEARMSNGEKGDWDTGPGRQRDGPYINKADLGNVGSLDLEKVVGKSTGGYYLRQGFDRSTSTAAITESGASFSPNRQIASAVSFGSLPSGIDPADPDNVKPWQTLLFCANPLGKSSHEGFGVPKSGTVVAPPYQTPPDHAFLDFFTMPIVEPFAISEPFSTAGKVNMNYQIVPFSYLTRSTGVRAVLKSTKMTALPTSIAPVYKENQAAPTASDCRYSLNLDERTGTLAGFERRFDAGDIFRSASEICDIFLVPDRNVDGSAAPGSPTYASMSSWWEPYELTGDNLRESPYGHIYPRLTTKSNTFTVHVQVQSISKSRGTPANQFVEGKDQITGEFRGSFLIERYLDPNSDSLVNSAGDPTNELDPDGMVGPYKFRVINSKRFAP